MEKDHLIILNGYVLTCDPANRGGRYDLLIRDGRIADVTASGSSLSSLHPEARVIDAENTLIVPGFVNAHFHSESVLFRPLTAGKHFELWPRDLRFRRFTEALAQPAAQDDLRSVMLASYTSHLKSGTTAVGEFPPAVDPQGMQTLLHSIERTDVTCVLALQSWPQIEAIRSMEQRHQPFLLNLGVEEDFTVYSLANLVRAARELSLALLAHIAERRDDAELVRKNFQKGILGVLRDCGALRTDTVLAHLNHAAEADLDLIEEAGCTVVLCARSAAYKQTGYPILRHLAARSVRVAIGTDWANVDMLEELRFLSQLPLIVSGIPVFSPLELLRMATINGAHALGIARETGSIEVGKSADLVFFSLDDLRLPFLPPHSDARDLAGFLVSHLTSRDISDVMKKGEFSVNAGVIATLTEEDIVSGFRSTAARWYPGELVGPTIPGAPGTVRDTEPSRAKIIPFVAVERPAVPETEGFEEGFSIIAPEETSPATGAKRPEIPPATPGPEQPVASKPTLSKNVRKTFGDDEV